MHRYLEGWEERDQHHKNYINLKLSSSKGQQEGEENNIAISSCEPTQVTLYLWTSFIHSLIQQVLFEYLLCIIPAMYLALWFKNLDSWLKFELELHGKISKTQV